jgi:hypothetical protein
VVSAARRLWEAAAANPFAFLTTAAQGENHVHAPALPEQLNSGEDAMIFSTLLPAGVTEWAWLFGFALVSLALVALAVLADALYEGYRERVRPLGDFLGDAAGKGSAQPGPRSDKSDAQIKRAA